MRKQEAIDLVNDPGRCPRCRWLAAGYILRGQWKRIDNDAIARAERIRWGKEPKTHK